MDDDEKRIERLEEQFLGLGVAWMVLFILVMAMIGKLWFW